MNSSRDVRGHESRTAEEWRRFQLGSCGARVWVDGTWAAAELAVICQQQQLRQRVPKCGRERAKSGLGDGQRWPKSRLLLWESRRSRFFSCRGHILVRAQNVPLSYTLREECSWVVHFTGTGVLTRIGAVTLLQSWPLPGRSLALGPFPRGPLLLWPLLPCHLTVPFPQNCFVSWEAGAGSTGFSHGVGSGGAWLLETEKQHRVYSRGCVLGVRTQG